MRSIASRCTWQRANLETGETKTIEKLIFFLFQVYFCLFYFTNSNVGTCITRQIYCMSPRVPFELQFMSTEKASLCLEMISLLKPLPLTPQRTPNNRGSVGLPQTHIQPSIVRKDMWLLNVLSRLNSNVTRWNTLDYIYGGKGLHYLTLH